MKDEQADGRRPAYRKMVKRRRERRRAKRNPEGPAQYRRYNGYQT